MVAIGREALRSALGVAIGIVVLVGCSVTPLTSKVKVGEEAFVIVVGEGPDGATDLFVAPATAGKFYRLTYTRVAEGQPRIGPSGTAVAFFRRFETETDLVILDLLTMAERRTRLAPSDAQRIAWSKSGDSIYVATPDGVLAGALATDDLGLSPIPASGRARADSLLSDPLGDPVIALIKPCRQHPGPCASGADSLETPLGADIADPFRWGPAAVGYVRGGQIEVRPLGGGRADRPTLTDPPKGIRQPTHHPGTTGRSAR